MKRPFKGLRLLLIPLAIPLFLVSWQKLRPNNAIQELRNIAGPNAIDCGTAFVPNVAASNAAHDCSVAAFRTHKPFILEYFSSHEYPQSIQNTWHAERYDSVAIAVNSKGEATLVGITREYKLRLPYGESVRKTNLVYPLEVKRRSDDGHEYVYERYRIG